MAEPCSILRSECRCLEMADLVSEDRDQFRVVVRELDQRVGDDHDSGRKSERIGTDVFALAQLEAITGCVRDAGGQAREQRLQLRLSRLESCVGSSRTRSSVASASRPSARSAEAGRLNAICFAIAGMTYVTPAQSMAAVSTHASHDVAHPAFEAMNQAAGRVRTHAGEHRVYRVIVFGLDLRAVGEIEMAPGISHARRGLHLGKRAAEVDAVADHAQTTLGIGGDRNRVCAR